jgi:hypothetical protein
MALVTHAGRDSLGFIDLASGRTVDAIRVGDEPAGLLGWGDTAWGSIIGEDRVVQVDLNARAVVASAETGHDPRGLVFAGDRPRSRASAPWWAAAGTPTTPTMSSPRWGRCWSPATCPRRAATPASCT